MADHFVKLWASITDSSIWSQPSDQRIVWVTMLTMADENGFVGASVDGLARRANVSINAVKEALESFLAPDPFSRNQDHEGRRIEVVDRGWHIYNHGHFRDLRDKEARRLYERERKAAQRAKSRTVPDTSRTSPKSPAMSAHEEEDAEEEAQADIQSTSSPKRAPRRVTPDYASDERFVQMWAAYGRDSAKKLAWERWKRLNADDDLFAKIMDGIAHLQKAQPESQYRPHLERWLRDQRWDERPPIKNAGKPTSPSQQVGESLRAWMDQPDD